MDLTHEFTVPAPVEDTWAAFNDIESVAGCFPGAQVTSLEGDEFKGTCKVKLGPIALTYAGAGSFVEKDEAARRLVLEAKGKDKRGNGTAGATVTATLTGSGSSTEVSVATDLSITGKPAQFGRGVIQDVSDKLLSQFTDCLESKLGAPQTEPTAEPVAEPSAETEPPPVDEPVSDVQEPSVDSTASGAGGPADEPVEPIPATGAGAGVGAGAGAVGPTPANDALDLGATVLPALARAYWKPALGGFGALGLLVVWRVVRRLRR
jgi:carbon monoxide dehydrogenase subunit G